ncbi:MAG: uroporphyrinogen decarboxylase [Treponema sp.]|jgi:uroporphyrinogen decarboxylase|nr:uroporphyrinogen decarboxylase [Treponema sp.]
MNKRDLVWKTFHNEKTGAVPVGFWFHFAKDELEDVFQNPGIRDINIEGHRKFFRDFKPDFLKIMTDGYFRYPNEIFNNARDVSDLKGIKPIKADHPWIQEQVRFAKDIAAEFGGEVLTFYTIFSPATIFKFARQETAKDPDTILADFMLKDKAAVLQALKTVSEDFAFLARAVISEGGVDGVYFSTQDVRDPRISAELQRECLAPGDFSVLESANAAGGLNILHICSYAGHHNEAARYRDYPAQVINWAASLENLSLREGKKIFGRKPVIGGFDNTSAGVLYRGSRAEIEAETDRILNDAGTVGIALGADCTLPRDISLEHLNWVRERAKTAAVQ